MMDGTYYRAGWRSSEFWLALLGLVLSLLVASGVLAPKAAEDLREPLAQAIKDIMVLITDGALIYAYIASRHDLKSKAIDAATTQEIEVDPQ